MRRVKTETVHLFSGGRDQGKRLVVRERTPNYQYLALFVYQLMESGDGIRWRAWEIRQWSY
jgi:hypothetical protein